MTDQDRRIEVRETTVVAILAAAAAVVLGAGWGYLTDGQAPYGDDNSAHFALMMHIADLWRGGVGDLWWNQSNLGLPLFMAYQPLPALVSGTAGALFADVGPRLFIFKLSIIGLWAAMPAAWYIGGRWLGLDRPTALLFGLLTIAVHDLHDVGFGFTAASYGGLYTQIWGMFFLPMTIGAFRRHVVDRKLPLVVPVGLFVVLSMSHLFCGMFAGIATLTWVAVIREDRRIHLKRTLRVYLSALLLLAFWLGPLIATSDLVGGLPWKNEYYNGWPAVELFRHLLGGDVFDHERLPWLTVLAFAGVVLTFKGPKRRIDRWLLALASLSLLLFMGRTNFTTWYDLIPMHEHINVMRYMNAIHLCGLLFAARAGAAILQWASRLIDESRVADQRRMAVGIGIVLLGGIYGINRYVSLENTLKTFDQNNANVRALVDHLSEDRSRRFAVSDDLNTDPHFYRDLIPALSGRAQLQSYALGYHATLSTYYADYIQYDSNWMRLFNVGAFVAREPFDRGKVEGFEKTLDRGAYRVYEPKGVEWGYFDFVRTPAVVAGDYRAIRPGVRRLLAPGFELRSLPLLRGPTQASERAGAPLLQTDGDALRWKGRNARGWVEKLQAATPDAPIRSSVVSSSRGPNWYAAQVRAEGDDERLMLKANYFPFWHASVDGQSVEIDHVAPNFMAIDVPEGRHDIRFTYRNPWWQKLGALLSLWVLCGWGGWRWRRGRA